MKKSELTASDPVPAKRRGVAHDIDDEVTQNVLKRLRNIEGQVRGLQRMVEEDQYCIDILTQIAAARSALSSAGMKVLRRHIDTCITDAIQNDGRGKHQVIEELMTILSRQER